MKRYSILLILVLTTANLVAQDKASKKSEDVKKKVEETVQSGSRDRLVVDFLFVNWAQLDGKTTDVKWFSRGYNIYFMYDIIIAKSRFSVAPGLGFGLENAVTDKALFQDTASTSFVSFASHPTNPASKDYKKYKLNTVYLDVPLELRFRGKPNSKNKSFKMAVGIKGGIMLDNHTKLKYEERGKPRVIKQKNYADLMLFRYGPTFRIGFGAFNLIGYYSLGPLFNSNGPSNVHPFAVGFSINGL